jgi:hypothetical protein
MPETAVAAVDELHLGALPEKKETVLPQRMSPLGLELLPDTSPTTCDPIAPSPTPAEPFR